MRKRLSVSFRWISSVLMLIALNACTTVGPDFTTPPADVTDDWIEEGDQRLMAEPADFRKWWTAFEDPVLDRLIETAYERNLSLRIAGVRVAEARAILGIAVGEFYPQVQQGFGSLEYIRGSERAPSAPQPPLDKGTDYSFRQAELGAGVGWELDFWGRFRRAIESAEADFFSSIANYDNVLVSLTSDVAATYVLYRTFEERIRIALENMDTQRESLEIATTRFDNGATSERDVQQAQTQLSSTEATIPALEISMRKSRNALGVLLGMTPAEVGSLVNEDGQIPLAPLELAVGIPADLLRRRPDIREAEYQAAAQSALIGVAKADLYPAFSLNGSFGFLASDVGTFDLGDIFEWKSRNGFFGPSFQWNLFNYGRITNNVRVQDARLQERILAYQDVVLRAQQEVEDGLADYLKGQERVFLLTKAAEAAKRSAELALIQYREGATDYTTVLTALQSQLDQQESLAISLGEVPQGMIAVYRALGGGWELREGNPFIPTADAKEMEDRTDWGGILLPVGLDSPAPSDGFPGIRRPDW